MVVLYYYLHLVCINIDGHGIVTVVTCSVTSDRKHPNSIPYRLKKHAVGGMRRAFSSGWHTARRQELQSILEVPGIAAL